MNNDIENLCRELDRQKNILEVVSNRIDQIKKDLRALNTDFPKFIKKEKECPACDGWGKQYNPKSGDYNESPCEVCNGTGRVRQ